ncbi:MAG: type I methionyl aminopeptidase [Clostridia bacterium]
MTSKTPAEIVLMRMAGKITGDALKVAEKAIKPGVSTLEINALVDDYIRSQGAIPTFLGFDGYPFSICASVNEAVVHGFSNSEPLKEGDIVGIDVGACYKGFNGDAARTFAVGKISKETQELIDVTKQSFFEGIKALKVGGKISDVSRAIQTYVENHGFSVVRELVGHGIGREMHEDPQIPNYVDKHSSPTVVENACLAIEPMVNQGKKEVWLLEDGWTVVTRDGKPSAHYENTVLVTKDGVEILTI